MKHLSIYGASDDLIEFEGDVTGADEFNPPGSNPIGTYHVAGLCITVEYLNGVWGIRIAQIGEEIPVEATNITLGIKPYGDGTEPGYSMLLEMDVPDDTVVAEANHAPA